MYWEKIRGDITKIRQRELSWFPLLMTIIISDRNNAEIALKWSINNNKIRQRAQKTHEQQSIPWSWYDVHCSSLINITCVLLTPYKTTCLIKSTDSLPPSHHLLHFHIFHIFSHHKSSHSFSFHFTVPPPLRHHTVALRSYREVCETGEKENMWKGWILCVEALLSLIKFSLHYRQSIYSKEKEEKTFLSSLALRPIHTLWSTFPDIINSLSSCRV